MEPLYVARNLLKISEEDDWEEGCLSNTGQMFEITVTFTGKSPDAVIQQIADFVGVDGAGIEYNACDEIGRVDFTTTETADGSPITDREIARWQRKEIKAYYCTYTAHIERCTRVDLRPEMLSV